MLKGIKIFDIKSFVRVDEYGELRRERIYEIIREIGKLALCFPEKNIMLDFRETRLKEDLDVTDAMKFAIEASYFGDILINKIACLVPGDRKRLSQAEKMRVALHIKGINYNYFDNFEHAIEWLSNKDS